HGDRILELVRHVLDLVEVLGGYEVHPVGSPAPVAAAAAAGHRAQRGGATLGLGIVGEDVVKLVTPAAGAEPPNVRTVAVGVLSFGFGLGVRLEVILVVLVVRQPEVHQRAVPGVSYGHLGFGLSLPGAVSLP